jgi:hypothetical protein
MVAHKSFQASQAALIQARGPPPPPRGPVQGVAGLAYFLCHLRPEHGLVDLLVWRWALVLRGVGQWAVVGAGAWPAASGEQLEKQANTGKGPRQHPLHWEAGQWSATPPPLSSTHTPGTQAPVASLSVALSLSLEKQARIENGSLGPGVLHA